MTHSIDLASIQSAAELLKGKVVRTPLSPAPRISEEIGCNLSLKLENLQHTCSFKARGAYVKLSGLTEEERARGVVAMSAGNHAQGVAYHARLLSIPSVIVMPETTPFSKIEATRAHGAEIILEGRTLADCRPRTEALIKERGLTLVHPYDDPEIVRGQGTVGLEIDEDAGELDTVVVPIGGGGLISGIAIALKALRPSVRMIGVQVDNFPAMYEAIRELEPSSHGSTMAEGIAVKAPGELTRKIVEELVDEIILVPERAIERAVQHLVEKERIVAEGAGAAGVAALLHEPVRFAGQNVATIICGGNIDSRILSSVLMRGLVRDGRMVSLRIEISDEPGALAAISRVIGESGGNIVEVIHQRLFQDIPVKQAELDIVVETRNAQHVSEITGKLEAIGMKAKLMSSHSASG